jgi:hypothetical protein
MQKNIPVHIKYFVSEIVKSLRGYGKLGYVKEKKILFAEL